jgi:hypothetical protein
MNRSMRHFSMVAALCLMAFLPCPLDSTARCGEETTVERIVAVARDRSQVMDHLDFLSNRIGPRLTGSDSLQTACEWTSERFRSFGLESRLEQWGEFAVGFNRGPWSGRVISPEPRTLEFGTHAWTAGTRGIVRGRAVLAPQNDDELSTIKDSLAGAWVLTPDLGRPAAPGRARAAGASGRANPAESDATTGSDAARSAAAIDRAPATQAAAAAFRQRLDAIYKQVNIAGVVRPTRNELIVTSGSPRITWDNLPTTPSINLVRNQFEEIVAWLKEGKSVELEFDIRNYFRKGPVPLYNVIADIPGTEWPDEYVIVGGHIDTWDGATGTTDNGTGCATALEAARILMQAGSRPRRTIRFMLWSGEEQGLLGSSAYVKAHPELLPKISAVLVHDGGTNYLSGIGATEAMLADMEQVFEPVKALDPAMPFAVRKVDGLRGGGSDHAPFIRAGVPGFFWAQSGRASYTRTHHTQFDTYDAAIPEYQQHSATVIAIGAYGLANLDHLLSREKMTVPGGGSRRTLGVQLDENTVTEVSPDSVADKCGMRAGDVIVSIEGSKITDRQSLTRALQSGEPKKKIVVMRDGKEIELVAEWQ